VFESLKSTLSKIEDLGNTYVVPKDIQQWYRLIPTSSVSLDEDVAMEGIETDYMLSASPEDDSAKNDSEDEEAPSAHGNNVVSYIDAVGRVC